METRGEAKHDRRSVEKQAEVRRFGADLPLAVMIVALTIRLVALYAVRENPNILFQPIGQEVATVGLSIARGMGFAGAIPGIHRPTALIPPVYPLLLAFGFRVLHTSPPGNSFYSQILNSIFSALTCWPVYLIGKRLFGSRIGTASAWLWAFLPTAVLLPLEWIWDQDLTALLLAVLICVAFTIRDSENSLVWFGYGLGWALALLTNPSVGVLLPFLLVWFALHRNRASRAWWRPIGLTVCACIVGILPWTVRNYRVFGKFIPIRSNFGTEFWLGNNAGVKTIWTYWRSPLSDPREYVEFWQVGEIAYIQEKQQEALAFIKTHPGLFVMSSFDRFVDTWTAVWDSHADLWIKAMNLVPAWVAFNTIFSLLAIFGALIAYRRDGADLFPLLAAMVFLPATYYFTHSSVRYRHPIDPVMTVLAVYAVSYIWSTVKEEKGDLEILKSGKAAIASGPLPRNAVRQS